MFELKIKELEEKIAETKDLIKIYEEALARLCSALKAAPFLAVQIQEEQGKVQKRLEREHRKLHSAKCAIEYLFNI